jgi:hypothetical protein
MIGSRLGPYSSPKTKAKEPVCEELGDSPNISNLIFSTNIFFYRSTKIVRPIRFSKRYGS